MSNPDLSRRRLMSATLAGMSTWLLAGCDRLNNSSWFPRILQSGETLSKRVHKLIGRRAMAQEFTDADVSPRFRGNGNTNPEDPDYQAHVRAGFAEWALVVDGLVEHPRKFTLQELKSMPSRTQITRHDCVEGWSAIGKWTGVPLGQVLARARPTALARYVVFHCADAFPGSDDSDEPTPYYESIDMEDAYHAQTILAYELNGELLPVTNGAPLRLRVERQLGYKHAKYIMRVELAQSLKDIGEGKGGYWEDSAGYQWYAGI